MGDYRNHYSETGRSLCESFNDVVEIKRDNNTEIEERQRIELMKRKLEHF